MSIEFVGDKPGIPIAMQCPDGGPAFPIERMSAISIVTHESGLLDEQEYIAALATLTRGMSLHDYFAAHAPFMPAPMRKMAEGLNRRENGRDVFDFAEYATLEASWRMAYANAMLAARSKA